jgi:glycosyltransferase involved in cell wall biosynthesis
MDLSIIIPSHNRAALVTQAVRSAFALCYPAERYEIIVVDNASTDSTPEMVEALQEEARGKVLRYVREDSLGLQNARHAGARAAKGKILLFTDDDATFDRGWARAHAEAFARHKEMVASGGPVRPIWETDPPQWLLDYISESKIFPILSLMEPHTEFCINLNGFFFGVNMAIRRDILFELGGFNPESFGDIWLGDGETGLNRKLWKRGLLIGYVPDAVVYHHIPPERMTVDYFRRRMANEGACLVYANYHHGIPAWPRLLRSIAGLTVHNFDGWIKAFLLRDRNDQRALDIQTQSAKTQSQVKYLMRLLYDKNLRSLVLKQDWLSL